MATSLIQKKTGSSASTASLVITLDALPRSGNTLIVAVANGNVAVTVSGGGATWSSQVASGAQTEVEIWAGVVNGTPSTTITITLTAAAIAAVAMEWAGVLTKDQTGTSNNGGGTPPLATATITPTTNDQLIMAAFGLRNSGALSGGPSNGFVSQGSVAAGGITVDPSILQQGDRTAISTTQAYTGAAIGVDSVIVSFRVRDAYSYTPVRIANRRVGPMALRQRFRLPWRTAETITGGAAAALAGQIDAISNGATAALTTSILVVGATIPAVSNSTTATLTTAILPVGNTIPAVSALTGALTTAILPVGGAIQGVSNLPGATLTTVILPVGGTMVGVSALTGSLTATIQLVGLSTAVSGDSGTLTGVAAALQGVAAGVAADQGSLTTAILLTGSGAAIATLLGDLTGGGAAPVVVAVPAPVNVDGASPRRFERNPYPDYTLADDDEAVLDLYLLSL